MVDISEFYMHYHSTKTCSWPNDVLYAEFCSSQFALLVSSSWFCVYWNVPGILLVSNRT